MFYKLFLAMSFCFVCLGAEACPSGLREFNKELGNLGQDFKKTCVLEGTYVGSLDLTSSFNYILFGPVYIGSEKREADASLSKPIQPGVLTVNQGVKIFALNPSKDVTGLWDGFTKLDGQPVQGDLKSFLSVTRDSQIIVKGQLSDPILMTSAQGAHLASGENNKRPGDWGGLVISGKAKSNKCIDFSNCTLPGEAGTGWYGGDDDFHSSGAIEYLQVEYGGDRVDDQKELNGITFNTIGLGTRINNIAVLYNSDDCIEFFGGAAKAQNIFCYKGEDDGIDTTDGARVFLQNGIVVAADFPEAGDDNDRHMVEADSAKTGTVSDRLQSHPILVNFSFIGGIKSQGLMVRRQTNYSIFNSVMVGVDQWCLNNSTADELLLVGNVFSGCGQADPISGFLDNDFLSPGDLLMSQWLPSQGSPLLSGAATVEEFYPQDIELDDAFYDAYSEVDYRGAMGSTDWTSWIETRD